MSGHEHSKDNFAYKEKTKVGPKEKVTISRFVMINLEKNNGNIIPMEKEVSHGGIVGGVIEENNKFTEEQWRNDADLIQNVVNMEHQLTEWNYNVFGRKYVARILEDDNLESKATDSSLWKAIVDSSHHISNEERWAIGSGSTAHAWKDKWIDDCTRVEDVVRDIPYQFQNLTMSELTDDLDRWILWNLNMRAHSMYGISWLELWANACHLIWVNSINIRWIPPDPGWICLNTDGPLKRDLGFAVVELWGVFKGLNLARAKNFSHVVLHVDSLVVVQVSHVYKEGNMCADALANLAYQMQESDSVVFELAPSSICSLVSSTARGDSLPQDVLL
ncbi:hypothetical protein JHK87_010535 [Glycine soja]|nr:hypothetical protein JHK87_010535 [Glycine soja]